jgi:lysophospholipase L1-like esterase
VLHEPATLVCGPPVEFDGVIDFARAVADPKDPRALNPAYDSGDHLHLNDAGYRAMANAVNLRMLILGVGR